ncbi:VWA domain-containing protein [Acrocarpospora macrocephala]|uniref:Mg-protoporphyrin IX chelatase n=1 Tax=Acrocarpospora macrocephala TaxID=150177 RepID=A0A5M3X2P2_9ACTN|nr:VWA domain-containing protein [Acrocarpospora macrocephala]GES14936.1 magnesium chelatase [Acrocarpospora macrocephala]
MADLKLALVLNAVSPRVGGVLVRGEKGTAKSTIVRALAALLPPVEVAEECRFSCDPSAPDPFCPDGPHSGAGLVRAARLVELPVGASEDRLAGSLDLERALTEGVKAFEPGLLAAAHRGILYVDEVNLLHDHLVDLLLDAAALGTCYVEREGVSVRHAARFLLSGTMNPEEGELRPQLLDRFGLTVEARASRDPAERAEVIRRRLAYELDPEGFAARWSAEEAELARRIAGARALLPGVRLPDAALKQIATVCAGFEVDGMRADIVTAHAAMAHAAWQGRTRVISADVRAAARLALPHRRRRDPFDAPGLDETRLDELLNDFDDYPDDDPDDRAREGEPGNINTSESGDAGAEPSAAGSEDEGGSGMSGSASWEPDASTDLGPSDGFGPPDSAGMRTGSGQPGAEGREGDTLRSADPGSAGLGEGGAFAEAGAPYRTRIFTVPGVGMGVPGRRSRARTPDGRTSGSRLPDGRVTSVHLMATLRAAAPHQRSRGAGDFGLPVERADLQGVAPGQRSRGVESPGLRVEEADLQGAAPGQRSRGVEGPGLRVKEADLQAASGQRSRGVEGRGLRIEKADLREAVREGREGNLVLFTVDASGSMAARKRMGAVKAAVLSLLLDAYQRRDKVGLITFRGEAAELVLPPTSSVEAGAARMRDLRTGGRTPLAAGLLKAADVLRVERLRDPARRPLLVIVTDGRATFGPNPRQAATLLTQVTTVVVDCESGPIRLGLATDLAMRIGALPVRLDALAEGGLAQVVRATRLAA